MQKLFALCLMHAHIGKQASNSQLIEIGSSFGMNAGVEPKKRTLFDEGMDELLLVHS